MCVGLCTHNAQRVCVYCVVLQDCYCQEAFIRILINVLSHVRSSSIFIIECSTQIFSWDEIRNIQALQAVGGGYNEKHLYCFISCFKDFLLGQNLKHTSFTAHGEDAISLLPSLWHVTMWVRWGREGGRMHRRT